ncbi:MAG: hypothetical protein DRG40_00285 [Deltaproteobacteria bacterium]|nr:MAG: hypothetical protein DRG40_00285 [Deltaproteobacteria bacterium]
MENKEMIVRTFAGKIRSVNEKDYTVEALVSDESIDRYNEVIRVDAWKKGLQHYKKHPVLLSSHVYTDLRKQIGEAVNIRVTEEGLVAKFKYYVGEGNPEADWAFKLASKGMAAYSVGFIPLKWEDGDRDDDTVRAGKKPRKVYTEVELLEISQVLIPANRNALQRAMEDEEPIIRTMAEQICQDGDLCLLLDDVVTKPEETEDYIHIPVRDPDDFLKDTFRTIDISVPKGIKAVVGKLKKDGKDGPMVVQKYMFDKSCKHRPNKCDWTMDEAEQWVKDHAKGMLLATCDYDIAEDEVEAIEASDLDDGVLVRFVHSPRNPFGSHCSFRFKGGKEGYKRAWKLHFSQVNGGKTDPASCGPIRGTIRRIAMIAAAMKPPCKVVSSDKIPARQGPKSPLPGKYPQTPQDYGLKEWLKPSEEGVDPEKALRLTCEDLNIIKRAAVAELKRRIQDREEKTLSEEEIRFFEWLNEWETLSMILSDQQQKLSTIEDNIAEMSDLIAKVAQAPVKQADEDANADQGEGAKDSYVELILSELDEIKNSLKEV